MEGAGLAAYDYLADAIAWAEAIARHHVVAESSLVTMSADDANDIILRLTPTADDAIPTRIRFISALWRGSPQQTGDEKWRTRADALFAAVAAATNANPIGHTGILNALDLYLRGREIVTAGPERAPLYHAALAAPFDTRMVLDLETVNGLPPDHPRRHRSPRPARPLHSFAPAACAHCRFMIMPGLMLCSRVDMSIGPKSALRFGQADAKIMRDAHDPQRNGFDAE